MAVALVEVAAKVTGPAPWQRVDVLPSANTGEPTVGQHVLNGEVRTAVTVFSRPSLAVAVSV